MLITCFLLCFSLYLFSSAFQVFSVIPLCIYAHFFNCLVKLFAELIECLCFKTLVSLVCWKFLSAQYEHYVFWLCVFVCRPWRCMGISMDYFSPKNAIGTVFTPHWTELLDFLGCRVSHEVFLHGSDVYTMRHQMENVQLLPLIRFSFRDESETTSIYTGFLIHRVLYTSFCSLLNFFLGYDGFNSKLAYAVNSIANVIFERFWNFVF